jgi:hypothetical protein
MEVCSKAKTCPPIGPNQLNWCGVVLPLREPKLAARLSLASLHPPDHCIASFAFVEALTVAPSTGVSIPLHGWANENLRRRDQRSAAPADTSTERRELAAIFASRRISAGILHACCARDL